MCVYIYYNMYILLQVSESDNCVGKISLHHIIKITGQGIFIFPLLSRRSLFYRHCNLVVVKEDIS